MDPDFLTAFHEAGHAVAAELYGQRITRVEIVGDADHTGTTEALRLSTNPGGGENPHPAIESVENRLRCVLAGTVAETMVSGREGFDETSEDLEVAARLAMKLVDDCVDVVPLLEEIRADLERVFRAQWTVIEKLAGELVRRKSLSGAEARAILGPLDSA